MSEQTVNIIWLAGIPIAALVAIILIPYFMIKEYKADHPNRDKMDGDEFAFVAMYTVMGVASAGLWPAFAAIGIIGGLGWLCYQMYLRA